ncbi:MAG: integrase arm-type DNA-binding domain-containing protein, partial [Desulfovibrio sp.]|nr:integrase arm-type DNA-binding domain-containing protein [Desulfovibrio sp.]
MGRLKDGMLQGLRFDEENKKWLTKTWELKKAPRFKSSLEEARGKITDGDGLTLYLTPAGSMIWRVEYRWQKTRKSYTIGPYTGDESGVSLSEAREALVQVKKWLREGKDPSEQKRAANAPKEDVVTFAKVARDWYDQCTQKRAPEYRKQIETRVKDVLIPAIGDIPIADLRGKDLMPLLREYEERGHCETAHKLAGHARQICQFASALGYCEFNAIAQLTGALQPVRTQHRAAILEPAAIGELLRRIYEYRGRLSVRYALRIMPYVFLRSKELRSARWADIDLDNAVWRVPGESMNMNRDHVVPLATQ